MPASWMPSTVIAVMIAAFLNLILSSSIISGQSAKSDAIVQGETGILLDTYLTRAAAFGFSGVLLVEKDHRIILSKGYGWADRAHNLPPNPRTPFFIASITKQFTAAAILKLEEQGKLKTDDLIGKYIKGVPADKAQVTIHHLLTHTSGLGDNYSATRELDREKAVQKILAQPLAAPIGTKFIYSNDGYNLLAAICELAAGESFESYVKKNLFAPAGMIDAGFMGEKSRWPNHYVARGYNCRTDFGSPQEWLYDWESRGGVGIIVSAQDLYHWEQALRQDDVLSASIKRKLFTPYAKEPNGWSYGYGWHVIETSRGTTELYHGGNETPRGFTAEYRRYLGEGVTTILLVNMMIDEIGLNRMVNDDIAAIIFGGKVTLPPSFIEIDQSLLQQYAGSYQLPSGDQFQIWIENGQLVIGAEGQEAVNCLTPLSDDVLAKVKGLSSQILTVIEAADKGETAGNPFKPRLDALKQQYGPFRGAQDLGTVPLLATGDLVTTYLRLRFERENVPYRWVRRGGKVLSAMQNTPLPAITQLMPQAENVFVGYNPVLAATIDLRFNRDGSKAVTELMLHTKFRNVTARKIK